MEEILKEIREIKKEILEIKMMINKNTENCEKMSSHIDFVDNVYEQTKAPINFVCDKINYMIGNSKQEILVNKEIKTIVDK